MYFCSNINYTLSDLKVADSFLLNFIRPLANYSASKVWIEEFRDFLIEQQQRFLEKNRRAKKVEISTSFHNNYRSRRHADNDPDHYDTAYLSAGSIHVHFVWIEDELHSFTDDNLFSECIKSIIRTIKQ